MDLKGGSHGMRGDYAIEVSDLQKHYVIESQVVRALNGVELKVPRGGVVAVTGQSGAGKSTLLQCDRHFG
jgi:ABC-type lipoprotein export system ATPase subunit